jgi:putative flippase GtrA
MSWVILIPAFEPGPALADLVKELLNSGPRALIVVDDGSGPRFRDTFQALASLPQMVLLGHAVNLGKGAALKTGLNYAACQFPDIVGVVTVDADGQHLPRDVQKVAESLQENPEALVLGVRRFKGVVPWRSRVGNALTRHVLRLVAGFNLRDTQTGLRGIPMAMVPDLLRLRSQGYDFELDMLLLCKEGGRRLVQTDIETVYLEDNKSSHFNPLLDSLKIYFVFLRYLTASVLTAVIDSSVFLIAFACGLSILGSMVIGRAVAVLFNYLAVRNAVFYSGQPHTRSVPRYLLLVVASGFVSYGLIRFLVAQASLPVVVAKILAESLIFFANFALQRDVVFANPERD